MKMLLSKQLPMATALAQLRTTKLRASLMLLAAVLVVLPALAQNNITVKGRIINDKGQAVSGASVVVKGTTNGTTTNETGNYTIMAPANATLVVSYVGYPTKEI